MLGQSFLRLGLVDEIRLMIAPVILVTDCTYSVIPVPSRSGILKNVVAYKNGLGGNIISRDDGIIGVSDRITAVGRCW